MTCKFPRSVLKFYKREGLNLRTTKGRNDTRVSCVARVHNLLTFILLKLQLTAQILHYSRMNSTVTNFNSYSYKTNQRDFIAQQACLGCKMLFKVSFRSVKVKEMTLLFATAQTNVLTLIFTMLLPFHVYRKSPYLPEVLIVG